MPTAQKLAIEGAAPLIPAGAHTRWPEILEADRDAVDAVMRSGQLWGAFAREVTTLQEEWAEYVGVAHSLAVNSGTAALHCGVVASGVEAGDEVIVPAFSFIATPMAVLHAGAMPVFADIDPETGNLDVDQLPGLITERTRAIMPVHIHGTPAEMDEVNRVAAEHGLAVIEDACQAHGATYKDSKVGSLGDCGAFSLNGAKNLMAGEGGLFVTDDDEMIVAARRLAIFGEDTPPLEPGVYRAYWSHGTGWNYRLHELTAALARSQLRRLDRFNGNAQRNADYLTKELTGLPSLRPPRIPDDRTSVYNRYRIRLEPADFGFEGEATEFRDRLLGALRAEGVAASTWQLLPLPAQPIFRRGGYEPWHPGREDGPLEPWDAQAFPKTTRYLDSSLVLGPEFEMLQVQTPELMEQYVEAFRRILARPEALLGYDYEPIRVEPPIPSDQL